ncbi:MAG TPA: hypothetical protein PKM44_01395 [Turneriella sp.]|nr:hypothetical protein [Turneriella sp.]HNJ65711.1 hypothetical protein [Turneriella sp.]HNL09137.1 hypothetical protein [Turneriella sp.]
MRPLRILPALLCLTAGLSAVSYEWGARSGESGFRLDVPEGWRTWESAKRNGVIVQFRRGSSRIEVRSMAAKDSFSTQQILNQKAARLSAEYPLVRYIGERPSRYSAELTLTSWEIRVKGKTFIEESAVYLAPEGPVVVSCMVRQDELEKYRTHCENAFYSLALGGAQPEKQVAKSDLTQNLQRLYLLHLPGNLQPVPPETLLTAPPPQTKPKPTIQYDENYILPAEENR